jgi:DNA invertase Pin-like site-specific DNA recombinase
MDTIIYLRTSTQEQNPENQLKDCEALAKRLGLNNYEVRLEKASAFKDTEREVFNQIKKEIQQGKIKNLIVWDLDRLFRNRIKTFEFIKNYAKFGLKVYSFRQSWFEDIKKIPEPFNEIVFDLMLQIMGWIAEEESKKKSERIKLAVRKENGITKSYRGKKWGRKAIDSERLKRKIKELREKGLSFREIQKHEEIYYYNKNKNKRKPSLATIYKFYNS